MNQDSILPIGVDAGKTISEITKMREAVFRQGKVTALQSGPPRTITLEVAGVSYTSIRVVDGVDPVIGEGLWVVDIGMGRWLGIATASTTLTRTPFVRLSGDTMTGGLTVTGTVAATSVTGNGSGLTSLNGSNVSSGTVATARLSTSLGRGFVQYNQVTTAVTNITTGSDIVTVSFNADNTRKYMITGSCDVNVATSNDQFAGTIMSAAGGTVLGRFGRIRAGVANDAATFHGAQIFNPGTTQPVSFKIYVERLSGTGSASTSASSTNPSWILVEDIGPQ